MSCVLGRCMTWTVGTAIGIHLCVDTLFSSPPGDHRIVWRYTQVTSHASTNPCSTPDSGTMPAVVGFAIERPDRIRYEFNAGGQLVDMSDGNGIEFRYLYDGSNRLTTVYEPLSCSNPATSTCRAFRLTYLANETDVTAPDSSMTKYKFDTASPAHLSSVVNPDRSTESYTSHR